MDQTIARGVQARYLAVDHVVCEIHNLLRCCVFLQLSNTLAGIVRAIKTIGRDVFDYERNIVGASKSARVRVEQDVDALAPYRSTHKDEFETLAGMQSGCFCQRIEVFRIHTVRDYVDLVRTDPAVDETAPREP